MAKRNYMAEVAEYRKLHPRCGQVEAMKKLAPKKHVGAVKSKPVHIVSGKGRKVTSPLVKSIAIAKKIEDLEMLLKAASKTETKNIIKRLINAEHDKLDILTKNLKSA